MSRDTFTPTVEAAAGWESCQHAHMSADTYAAEEHGYEPDDFPPRTFPPMTRDECVRAIEEAMGL